MRETGGPPAPEPKETRGDWLRLGRPRFIMQRLLKSRPQQSKDRATLKRAIISERRNAGAISAQSVENTMK